MTEPMTVEEARQEAKRCEAMADDSATNGELANMLLKDAATLRAYADMLEREASVKVKPLVWRQTNMSDWEAETPFGDYLAHLDHSLGHWWWIGPGMEEPNDGHDTLEAAIRSVFEHYEAAILSAIEGVQP